MIFLNSNFTNNSNTQSSLYYINIINLGVGGVLYSAGRSIYVSNCVFSKNSNLFGGVFTFTLNLNFLENIMLIQNSFFLENSADKFAGVIYFPPGFRKFNCTLDSNQFLRNFARESKENFYYIMSAKLFSNFFRRRCVLRPIPFNSIILHLRKQLLHRKLR